MRIPVIKTMLVATVLLLGSGCTQEEQLKKIEQESGDTKIEVFKLRMQIEEMNKRSEDERKATAEARVQDRRFQADLQETLRQLQDATRVLGNRLNDSSSSTPRRSASTGTSTTTPSASADELTFNSLLFDYNRGNYTLAADNFQNFIKANPKSSKRPDALYYLGFSHYNLKAFEKAMDAFNRLIKDYPNSEYFLSAKFKKALCQQRLGLKPAAIASFQEIIDNFPGTPEARNAQQELSDLQN
jgi:tol-pal system protein YbgF